MPVRYYLSRFEQFVIPDGEVVWRPVAFAPRGGPGTKKIALVAPDQSGDDPSQWSVVEVDAADHTPWQGVPGVIAVDDGALDRNLNTPRRRALEAALADWGLDSGIATRATTPRDVLREVGRILRPDWEPR